MALILRQITAKDSINMAWFTRSKQNIDSTEKRENDTIPDGMWTKCPDCKEIIYKRQLEENFYMCPKCEKHFRIGSEEYFEILLDAGLEQEIGANLVPSDPLDFVDTKPYPARVADAIR